MDQSDYAKFQAAMEIGDYTSSLQEIINLTENLDCYEIYPNIGTMTIWAAITSKN